MRHLFLTLRKKIHQQSEKCVYLFTEQQLCWIEDPLKSGGGRGHADTAQAKIKVLEIETQYEF